MWVVKTAVPTPRRAAARIVAPLPSDSAGSARDTRAIAMSAGPPISAMFCLARVPMTEIRSVIVRFPAAHAASRRLACEASHSLARAQEGSTTATTGSTAEQTRATAPRRGQMRRAWAERIPIARELQMPSAGASRAGEERTPRGRRAQSATTQSAVSRAFVPRTAVRDQRERAMPLAATPRIRAACRLPEIRARARGSWSSLLIRSRAYTVADGREIAEIVEVVTAASARSVTLGSPPDAMRKVISTISSAPMVTRRTRRGPCRSPSTPPSSMRITGGSTESMLTRATAPGPWPVASQIRAKPSMEPPADCRVDAPHHRWKRAGSGDGIEGCVLTPPRLRVRVT